MLGQTDFFSIYSDWFIHCDSWLVSYCVWLGGSVRGGSCTTVLTSKSGVMVICIRWWSPRPSRTTRDATLVWPPTHSEQTTPLLKSTLKVRVSTTPRDCDCNFGYQPINQGHKADPRQSLNFSIDSQENCNTVAALRFRLICILVNFTELNCSKLLSCVSVNFIEFYFGDFFLLLWYSYKYSLFSFLLSD